MTFVTQISPLKWIGKFFFSFVTNQCTAAAVYEVKSLNFSNLQNRFQNNLYLNFFTGHTKLCAYHFLYQILFWTCIGDYLKKNHRIKENMWRGNEYIMIRWNLSSLWDNKEWITIFVLKIDV